MFELTEPVAAYPSGRGAEACALSYPPPLPTEPNFRADLLQRGRVAVDADGQLERRLVLGADDFREVELGRVFGVH
jgi:hypothetical protein